MVAGMHRSGTSAVARLMAGLGCDLPKTLMAGDIHNSEGYWESQKIADLNDAILASAGSSWDDWEKIDTDWYDSSVVEAFRHRASDTLAAEFGDSPLFVLKDPRICRLLPFWKASLERFGASVRVVVPLREPLEVAASLKARDAIETPFAILIWLRNVLAAEADSRDVSRAFVGYDDLLRNAQALAERLATKLDIRWPRRSTTARMAMDASLRPTLRHHVKTDLSIADNPSAWAGTAFEIFQRWSRDDERSTDIANLDNLRTMLDDAAAEFAAPMAIGMRSGQNNRVLDDRIAVLDDRIAALDLAVSEKDQLIETLDSHIQERDRLVADRDAKIDEMSGLIGTRDYQIVAAEQRIREHAQAADSLRTALDERARTIADLETKVDSLNEDAAAKDARIDDLSRHAESARHEIQAIKGSTSWRITKPLRLLKGIVVGVPAKASLRIGAGLLFGAMLGLWRLLPLGIDRRQRLRTFLVARMPVRLANRLAFPSPRQVEYMPAQWLDLPNLNYDAANGDRAVPILFDPQFYRQCNEDIGDADATPLQHYMRHGAIEGRLPFAIDASEIDPTVESLHRLNLASEATSRFDADFYRAAYADVAELDDDGAAKHFKNHGRGEGRVGSRGEFVRQVCISPCEIPLDFNAADYVRLYPDLASYSERPALEALRHYMVSGRREPRLHTLRLSRHDESIGEPEAPAPALDCSSPPLCILAHVYYPELWNELADYIRNIPEHLYQLHVNLVDTTYSHGFLATIRASFPAAKIQVSGNFGRDIGGHCQLLRNIDMDEFRFFLLIHTKNSPHLGEGGAHLWRRRLLMPLLGDRRRAVENIALLLEDDSVGQIGGSRCRDKKLDHNETKHRQLLERLGIADQHEASEFVSGTMMFVRREVLQRVYAAIEHTPFESGDDKPLAFHVDSQWAHAVERLFGDVVRDLGYRTEWR